MGRLSPTKGTLLFQWEIPLLHLSNPTSLSLLKQDWCLQQIMAVGVIGPWSSVWNGRGPPAGFWTLWSLRVCIRSVMWSLEDCSVFICSQVNPTWTSHNEQHLHGVRGKCIILYQWISSCVYAWIPFSLCKCLYIYTCENLIYLQCVHVGVSAGVCSTFYSPGQKFCRTSEQNW